MNKENKHLKFKLRKTAAYGLASCLFVAGLALAPSPAQAAESDSTPATSEVQTAIITIHVTDKTTGETKTFTAEQRVGDYINVPEIITLVYPKNQYHSDWSQTYMTKPSNNVWNLTVEKYAENPYEILPTEKVDVKRTINITYPDGKKDTIVQTAQKYRTRRKVVATGEIQVSPWRFPPQTSYWNDFTTKEIKGYSANIPYLKAVGEPAGDETVNINYTANQQNVSGTIQFTSDGKVVGRQYVSGIQSEPMTVTLNVPIIYTIKERTKTITLTKENDIINIPVEHKIVDTDDETKVYTRMIILKVPGQEDRKIEQTLTSYRSQIMDLVTGIKTPTTPWLYMETWPEYVLPTIEGYKAPVELVEQGIAPTENQTITLTYTKIGSDMSKPVDKPSTGTDTTKPAEKPSTGTDTSKPAEKPSTDKDMSKPVDKPSTGTDTTKPADKPSTGTDTSKPAEKPSKGTDTTKPADKPSKGTDTTKPAEKPSTGTDTSKPAEKPSTGTDTSKPAEKPSTDKDMSKPVDKPSTGTDTTKPADKPSTGTDTSKPADKPSTGTDTSKPADKPSKGTDTTKPADKPSKGTDTTKPADKPSTGTDTSKPADKPSKGTDTTKPADKPSTGTDTSKPAEKPSKGTDTTKPADKPSTGTDTTKPADKSSTEKDATEKSNTKTTNASTKNEKSNLPKKLDKETSKQDKKVKEELPKAGATENAWLAILGMGSIVSALGVAEINRRKD